MGERRGPRRVHVEKGVPDPVVADGPAELRAGRVGECASAAGGPQEPGLVSAIERSAETPTPAGAKTRRKRGGNEGKVGRRGAHELEGDPAVADDEHAAGGREARPDVPDGLLRGPGGPGGFVGVPPVQSQQGALRKPTERARGA